MVRLRKHRQSEEPFQMAPMIDMVFLLLVFFMTVSTLARGDRRELDLADSQEAVVPRVVESRGIVSIDASGSLTLGSRAVTSDELREALQEAKSNDPSLALLIRAEAGVPYAEVRVILEMGTALGFGRMDYAVFED